MQLDDPGRGFSFRLDGPLDMRMEQSGCTVADLINTLAERELAEIIYQYGEERYSRKIAKAIILSRKKAPITHTEELANLVRRVVKKGKDRIDPATRTFQAFRIFVNDELREVERGLQAAEDLLIPGGRLAVVSFHSLEDRLVKQFLRSRSTRVSGVSRYLPEKLKSQVSEPTFKLNERKSLVASVAEVRSNPRSRSARLRWAERTAAPSHKGSLSGVLPSTLQEKYYDS